MGDKIKKKVYKKWWFWLIVVVVIGTIGNMGSDKATKENKEVNSKQNKTNVEEPKEEKPKEEFNFSATELNIDNVNKAMENILNDKLVSSDLTVEDGKNIVDIIYNPGTVWDDKALVKNNAVTATEIMEVLFSNPKVDKVWVWTQTEMTDAKGNKSLENVINVCLTKENATEINWSNFSDMVLADYNALYKIADSNFIHPGIAKNIKK